MNTHVRDNLKAIGDPWASYTPAWTATTTNPTIGNGTITGAWMSVGKLVHFRAKIVFGSTTTAGSGAYLFSLPATMSGGYGTNASIGVGSTFDTSAPALQVWNVRRSSSTTVVLTQTTGTNVTNSGPFTWATGDEIELSGTYEAA